jgi:membrane protease YdiL (CAAX protease family)
MSRIVSVPTVRRCAVLRIAFALVLALLGAAFVFTMGRTAALEANELDARGEVVLMASLERDHPRDLVDADLEVGEDAVFEICSSEPEMAWGDEATVLVRAGNDVAVEARLDAAGRASARRSAQGACLDVGRGRIQQAGRYTITMESPAVEGVNIRGRILARRPLRATDRNGVLAILGAALVLVMLFAFRSLASPRKSRAPRAVRLARVRLARARRRRPLLAATLTLIGGLLGLYAAGMLPRMLFPMSSAYVLLGGGVLALGEVFFAWMLIDPRGVGLALKRPNSVLATAAFFVAAPFVGLGLRMFAGWALSHVESTGEAPIEAFVSWPSGLLSFSALAVVAPIAEEVFFRGFVFGTIDNGQWGGRRALACVASFGLFAGAHWEQVQGNWGGLLSVTMAGVVFTLLRAISGSTLVPAIAHLTYNALLSTSVLTAASILILPG